MISSLTDSELSSVVLSNTNPGKDLYLFVANAFTVSLYAKTSAEHKWMALGSGELGDETLDALGNSIKSRRVQWLDTDQADTTKVEIAYSSTRTALSSSLRRWVATANKITQGRGAEPDHKVKHAVGASAGWHCQFEGCGENLSSHVVPGTTGNFSYFAHIIASSPQGPRGHAELSSKRAQDPENLMLLCDKCHRLIDRVAPHKYPADKLFEMRRNNLSEVARLLGKLKFESAQMIAVVQNIQGQVVAFNEKAAEEAMWAAKLRKGSEPCQYFMRNGDLSTSNDHGYWYGLFKALKIDVPVLQRLLRGTDSDNGRPKRIALFPLHSTSVLIAAGRILGEASSIVQFQFDRDRVAGGVGKQWAWSDSPTPEDGKYKINIEKDHEAGSHEALLRVHLTARIPNSDLPKELFFDGQLLLPAIEITADIPSRNIIGHPYDLELLGKAIDEAYRKLQDEWHIKKVHLIVIAPATACVRVGQKMQARNQTDFVLYERNPAIDDKPFQSTITITSTNFQHASGEKIDID